MTPDRDTPAPSEVFPGRSDAELAQRGAACTAREIAQQPVVWQQVARLLEREQPRLDRYLKPLLADPALRVVLTGAGTSAFIGVCLAPALARQLQRRVDAIATTDLVTGPQLYLQRDVPTLLVSFARSGNSPESVATIDLAEQLLDQRHHLIFTCNADGALAARAASLTSAQLIVLPEAANDRGFAMTSSFSSMLLAASLVFGVIATAAVPRLADAGRGAMARAHPLAERLAEQRFERVVYLGSNELRGLAFEAALKLLELTDGRTVAIGDSVLGFRHGPKTIINGRTLVIVFQSSDPYARTYERDLLAELRRDACAGAVLTLGARGDSRDSTQSALEGVDCANDIEVALLGVLFAQIYALRQSLTMGLTPDRPNAAGVVNRVVQGVTIYPWPRDQVDVPGR
jgi:tagatose-6-phosphate ketose/aldose isomerase